MRCYFKIEIKVGEFFGLEKRRDVCERILLGAWGVSVDKGASATSTSRTRIELYWLGERLEVHGRLRCRKVDVILG